MLPPLATVEQLVDHLPVDVTLDDQTRAEAALTAASTLVRDEAKTTWVDTAGNLEPVPDIVVVITLAVAARSLNRSFVYGAEDDAPTPPGGLYLKADEKRRLAVFRGTRAAFGSARLASPAPFGWS